jgi:Family of unknown function (DUF6463)
MDRFVGPLLMLTGIGHALVGVVLFHRPLAAIRDAGFFNAIQPPSYVATPHFDRIAAFWFLVFSPLLVLLGQLTSRAVRRRDTHTLDAIGWYLLAIGVVGVAVLPVSGNWVLIGLGGLVLRAGRTNRSSPIQES